MAATKRLWCAWGIWLLSTTVWSAVLPEDRADLLYHSYDGGGVTISGPSVLVRKEFANKLSVAANYYVDKVTGASVDVQVSASPYFERRTETSLAADYLHDRTLMSVSYTNSSENDYQAEAVSFGVSQDFFGDMTTLALGFSLGDDTVSRNGDEHFEAELQRRRYTLSLTQVLTRSWLVAVNAESVVDEGFLNNPYRSVRYLDSAGAEQWQKERYPNTRNSDALGLRSTYHLPWRGALRVEARAFGDSWGIEASNAELGYTHSFGDRWLLEGRLRYYEQNQADFYSDLYTHFNAQNFLARDKELSTFSSVAYGLGVTYRIDSPYLSAFDATTMNLFWDHLMFDYENFRDARVDEIAPSEQPLYSFDANVIRLFLSLTY